LLLLAEEELAEGALLVPVADAAPMVMGLSVEVTTGEVGVRVTVEVPCSTSKYIP
jgi:hypothetical protein